jgi:ADP-heptose:LPS heptosyltransferase
VLRGNFVVLPLRNRMENSVRILVIRFSSIGDIVLTTPVVRCLKQQLEGEVEVHYLVKKKYAMLLSSNPYVHTVHTIEKSTNEVCEALSALRFDYIIDLHRNLRSMRVKSKLKSLAFTFNKYNIEKWLLVNFGLNRMPNVHLVDRYFEAAKPLGITNDGLGLDYFIPTQDEVMLNALPTAFQKGYIAFAIGGTFEGKKLPPAKLQTICVQLDFPILLMGGKEDAEVAEKIAGSIGSKVVNACGRYSLNQSASLLKQSTLVITHDTGLMHIAAAFKKNIVSIWGATVPEFGMSPYMAGPHSMYIAADHLSFRPTSKLGNRNTKRERRTMEEISEKAVVNAVNRIVKSMPDSFLL